MERLARRLVELYYRPLSAVSRLRPVRSTSEQIKVHPIAQATDDWCLFRIITREESQYEALAGIVIAALFSLPASADSFYHGLITKVGVLGNGDIFIEFPVALTTANCSHPIVQIASTNAAKKEILSVALAAYLAETRVYLQVDNCYGGFPTLTGAQSWIYPAP